MILLIFIHSLYWGPSTAGCLYGDGYIKIFAGESAEDESALLAFETAEFESELQIVSQHIAVVDGNAPDHYSDL
jgi:hypothetical protein